MPFLFASSLSLIIDIISGSFRIISSSVISFLLMTSVCSFMNVGYILLSLNSYRLFFRKLFAFFIFMIYRYFSGFYIFCTMFSLFSSDFLFLSFLFRFFLQKLYQFSFFLCGGGDCMRNVQERILMELREIRYELKAIRENMLDKDMFVVDELDLTPDYVSDTVSSGD